MMATSLKHEAFHKNLECPICLSFFKEPKNLTCSHTFCKGCLQTLLETRGKLLCPTCRKETAVLGGDVGRLPSNITVRSLVEDVETQGRVCSNSNQENDSLQRKWNKCRKHPNYDEECFCLNCNKYICCKCGITEHAKDAHTILEAGEYETEQKNHVEKLASKADAKIRNVDKYFAFVEDQCKRVHNIQKRLNGEIDATFEEFVEKLKERKTELKNEIENKLGKLETSLADVAKSIRKQIDDIKKILVLVKDGLNFPLQTEALTSYKAMCQQLEELLNRIRLDEELPRRTAEEGERIAFRSQGSDGLRLGQLTHTRDVLEAGEHETDQKNHVEKLASKADARSQGRQEGTYSPQQVRAVQCYQAHNQSPQFQRTVPIQRLHIDDRNQEIRSNANPYAIHVRGRLVHPTGVDEAPGQCPTYGCKYFASEKTDYLCSRCYDSIMPKKKSAIKTLTRYLK